MSDGTPGRPSALRLYSLIFLMTFLWSVNYIIGKFALRELPGMLVVSLRMALAGTLMIPVYLWQRRQPGNPQWDSRDVPRLLSLGLLGVTLNQLFFVVGLARTSVAHASLFVTMAPMLVLLIAALVGHEKLKVSRVLGLVLAGSGVAILQLFSAKNSGVTLLGDFFVFLCALSFAMFAVYGRPAVHRFGSITLNTFAYVAGGIVLAPVTWWYSKDVHYENVTWKAWLSLLFMAAISSVFCYLIFSYALHYIPSSRVSAFSYLQPVLATTMAILWLHELPSPSLFVAGPMVLAGVFVAERG